MEPDHDRLRERPWLRRRVADVLDRQPDLLANLSHDGVLQAFSRLEEPGQCREHVRRPNLLATQYATIPGPVTHEHDHRRIGPRKMVGTAGVAVTLVTGRSHHGRCAAPSAEPMVGVPGCVTGREGQHVCVVGLERCGGVAKAHEHCVLVQRVVDGPTLRPGQVRREVTDVVDHAQEHPRITSNERFRRRDRKRCRPLANGCDLAPDHHVDPRGGVTEGLGEPRIILAEITDPIERSGGELVRRGRGHGAERTESTRAPTISAMTATRTLVLLRHGHSLWNQENRFTGWYDVDLAPEGVEEAIAGGHLLASQHVLPDVVHTSVLKRAVRTSQLALENADRSWIPVRRSWRLNERHYGDLQGKDKAETLEAFGADQFLIWRRSFDVPPPPVAADSPHHPANDPRYADLAPEVLPATECLADVLVRMLPYWQDAIVPDLRAGHTTLVVAHGNSLRALVMHLDGLSQEQVIALNIPTGIPLRYELDAKTLKPVSSAYLDPEAARLAAEKVANQGKR